MTKHTPGPWRVTHQTATDYAWDIAGNRKIVAHCGLTVDTESDIAANAHLIAAAPELLGALTIIATQCGNYAIKQPALDYASIGNIARQAIAKAEDK